MARSVDKGRIDEMAAAWVARRDRGPLSARQQSELDAWLAEDPRHLGAFARARAVMVHFERASALGEQYNPGCFAENAFQVPKDRSRRRFLWMAGTSMAAGLAGVAFLRDGGRRVSTRLGEVLRVPLKDGSAVTLNSASEIEVRYDDTCRLVCLLRGEALFDVAKDASRSFVVKAGLARVVAIGTVFTVRHMADSLVEVMVREGSVEFDSGLSRAKLAPVRLSADMLAMGGVSRPVEVKPLQPMDVTQRLAWRDGMISFNGDTLAQAAAQFARYSKTRIVIDDPRVAERQVVGLYSATDPVGFARSVAMSMSLHVERVGNTVHLEK